MENTKEKVYVITSGGTSEYIDRVRKITNSSSGKLGCTIAEELLKDESNKIIYIHAKGALKPSHPKVTSIEIITTKDLEDAVKEVLNAYKVDVFIHSMAVSDYTVKNVIDMDKLREAFYSSCDRDFDSVIEDCKIDNSSKISSSNKNPMITLEENPKIISLIKKLSPYTFLVGFKLLDNVSEDELFEVGFNLLRKNRCNLVLANDISSIRSGNHTGMIIYPEKNKQIVYGKKAIASTLINEIHNRAFVKHPKSIHISDKFHIDSTEFEFIKNVGEFLFNKGVLPEVVNHNRPDKIGTYGNMSFKKDDTSFYITGRNVHKGKLSKDNLCFIENVSEVKNDSIYSEVNYHGTIKPSIDTAIHSKIYAETKYTHIIHIHTNKLFLGDIPLTDYNYPCGSMEERDAIIKFILENKDRNVIQLYKHGLIILGNSFDECIGIVNKLYDETICIDYDNKGCLDKEFIKHIESVGAGFTYNEGELFPICLGSTRIGTVWEDVKNKPIREINFALYLNEKERSKKYGLVDKYLEINKSNKLLLHTTEGCNISNFYINKYDFEVVLEDEDRIILEKLL